MSDPNDFWGRGGSSEPYKPDDAGLRDKRESEGPGFWSKEMAAQDEPARREEGFWEQAEARKAREREERETLLHDPEARRRRRRRIVRRVLLSTLAALLLAAALGILFLPQIASAFAPGIIARRVNETIAGSISVRGVTLSWGGPQRLEGVRLSDPDGKEVVRANVEADPDLWGLIRGRLDLGEVRIEGARAEIVRTADARTNLQRSIAPRDAPRSGPATGSPGGEPRLPETLNARIVVKGLDVSIVDEGVGAALVLRDVDIATRVAPGEPLNVKASLIAHEGSRTGRLPDDAGEISLDVRIEKWSSSDGRITPGKARVRGTLIAKGLPTSLVDALVPGLVRDDRGSPVRLSDALGRTCSLSVQGESEAGSLGVDFEVTLPEAGARGRILLSEHEALVSSPTTLHLSARAAGTLASRALAAARDAGVAIDAVPSLEVVLEGGRFVFPLEGRLDLRGAGVRAALAVGEWSALVTLPGQSRPRVLRVAPTSVRLVAEDLAKELRTQVRTSAALDASPAGELIADVTLAGMLDSQGQWAGVPASLSGTIDLSALSTDVIQPFVAESGLDLPADLGPSVSAHLQATSRTEQGGVVSTVSVEVRSAHAEARGTLEVLPTAIRLGDPGLSIRLARSGAVAARLLKPDTGWSIRPGTGEMTLAIVRASLPRDSGGRVRWDQLAGEARLRHGAIAFRNTRGDEILVGGTDATLTLRGGGRAGLMAAIRASCAGSDLAANVSLEVPDLFSDMPEGGLALTDPASLRPAGSVEIVGLAPGAPSLFLPTEDTRLREIGALIEHALGGPVDLRATFGPVRANPAAFDAVVEIKSARLNAKFDGALDHERAAVRGIAVSATISPEVADEARRLWAPDIATTLGQPALGAPARLSLTIEPVEIPLDGWSPVMERTPTVRGRLAVAGPLRVRGVTLRRDDGSARAIDPFGAENLDMRFEVPVAALVAPPLGDQRHASASVRGRLLAGDGALTDLDAEVRCEVSAGRLAGPASVRVRSTGILWREVDSLLELDGLLADLLGESGEVDLALVAEPPPTGTSEGWFPSKARFDATLGISASRLRTDHPLRVRATSERVEVVDGTTITLTPNLDALNTHLGAQGRGRLELLRADAVVLRLDRGSIPLARRGAPEQAPQSTPIPAEASVALEVPLLVLRPAGEQRATLKDVRLSAATEKVRPDRDGRPPASGPALVLTLSVAEAAVDGQEPTRALSLAGRVTSLFPGNALDVPGARLSLRGEAPAVPTAIIDALLQRDGEFVDLLGPVISIRVDITGYPLLPPVPGPDGRYPPLDPAPFIDLEARSSRATATIRGTVRDGMFVSDRPAEVTVREVTAALLRRYVGVTPVIGSVEKTPQDAPALITGTGLTVPLDRDWSRLNATINIDPGQCRFQTSGYFADILQALHQKTAGIAGTRVEPLTVIIRNGIVTYERWRLPLGEFTVQTAGAANLTGANVRTTLPDGREGDLPPGHIDVVTWIPAGALTDRALGMFNIGLGAFLAKLTPGLLEPLTLMPFRTRGPIDKPSTSAAVDLVGKDVLDQLRKLDPRRIMTTPKPPTPTTPTAPPTSPPPMNPPPAGPR
jgi:hypothetical protein